jgi:hypothetical protein
MGKKDARLAKQIASLSDNMMRGMVMSIAEALWGDEADEDWSADTLDSIAFFFHVNVIGPDEPLPKSKIPSKAASR